MPDTIKIFVSYSRNDAAFRDELLDFLKGLKVQDNIEFWTDQMIRPGEIWEDVIETNIRESAIALVVVSHQFLESDYIQKVEIQSFLAQKKHIFPIILSPCAWKEHAWLSKRRFLPGGDETIAENYPEKSPQRERLFLKIREHLRELVKIARLAADNDPTSDPGAISHSGNSGRKIPNWSRCRLELIRRLGSGWVDLAAYYDIPAADQGRFKQGYEATDIWVWLEIRKKIPTLPDALRAIGRADLANECGG